jgi:hypothetical protein
MGYSKWLFDLIKLRLQQAYLNLILPVELLHELKAYCERVNIPLTIILLLDNTPEYSPHISDIDENINVMFLPPNITSLIEPLIRVLLALLRVIFRRRSSSCLRTQSMEKTNFL